MIRTRKSRSSRSGANGWTAVVAGAAAAAGSTACGATVSSRVGPSSRASSSRLPPQRWRVTCHGSPVRTSVQFAASASPRRAATWAMHLGAAVAAGADHGHGRVALHELGEGLADRLGRVVGQARMVDRVEDGDAGRARAPARPPPRPAPRRRRGAAPRSTPRASDRASAPPATAGPARPLVLDDDEDHAISPRRRSTSMTRGAASGPSPRISTALSCSTGTRSRIVAALAGRPGRLDPLDLLLARAQPARHGRVARQVEALADGDRPPVAAPRRPPSHRRAASRRATTASSRISRPLTPDTTGRSSATASRIPTW